MKRRLAVLLVGVLTLTFIIASAPADASDFRRLDLGYTVPGTDIPWIDSWFPVDIDGDGTWELATEVEGSPRRFGVFDPESGAWLDGPRELPVMSYYNNEDGYIGWSAGDWNDDGFTEYVYISDSLRLYDTQSHLDQGLWDIAYLPHGLCAWGVDTSGSPMVALLEGHDVLTESGSSFSLTWNVQRLYTGETLVSLPGGTGPPRLVAGSPGNPAPTLVFHEVVYECQYPAEVPDLCSVTQNLRIVDKTWEVSSVFELPIYTSDVLILGRWSLDAASTGFGEPEGGTVWWLTGCWDRGQIPSAFGGHSFESSDELWAAYPAEQDARCGIVSFDFDGDGEEELLLPLTDGSGWERRDPGTGAIIDTLPGLPSTDPYAGPLFDPVQRDLFFISGSGLYIWGLTTDVEDDASSPAPVPRNLQLHAYPNPFNASVTFTWTNGSRATGLEILNILGQRVRTYDFDTQAEPTSIEWDGRDRNAAPVPSGVYFARLIADRQTAITKIVLLK